MAKAPGNRNDGNRDGGKDSKDRRGKGKGRDGRARVDAPKEPQRVEEVEVLVERLEGVRVLKRSRVDVAGRRPISQVYVVAFDGFDPIEFPFLSAARERAKEPPPELPGTPEPEVVVEIPEGEAEAA
jgi:hypothetical protein